ncbi:Lrp/AsnC family transcriptional regulator [Henriciella litoralis]|uniref:Lrp/AsnC family transcriptional regulator n=1 Tax=Henriciella litoralis TaxID=568102 RepID=UPI00146BDCC0|nr:Lrp/AsnC family transcriptional regulator [Henriciella litoralis]
MTQYSLDDIDRNIIICLAENGRVSNREIARRLDLTEGAIRARIKRLEADDIIRVSAVVNVNRLENPILAFIWIDAAPGVPVTEVTQRLSELPEIFLVRSLIGRADILTMAFVRDAEQLHDYVHNAVRTISGVENVRYSFARQIIKHDYRFTSII